MLTKYNDRAKELSNRATQATMIAFGKTGQGD
jgi:hypothetical protein